MLTKTRCIVDFRDEPEEKFGFLLGEGEIVADWSYVTDDCSDDRLKPWEGCCEVTYGPEREVLEFLAARAGVTITWDSQEAA